MAWMRNAQTGAFIGPLTNDSAEYLYLQTLKDSSNFPLYEDVGTQEVGTVGTKVAETRQVMVDALGATADATLVIARAPWVGVVSKVEYFPSAAVTGAASPASRTLNAINAGQAGGGSTNVAALALLGGVNLTANAANVITLNATAANLVVAANDEIEWNSAHVGGTGLVDPGGLVVVTFTRD